MNESVIVIVSVLVSTLITYFFVSVSEVRQSRKRVELMHEMYDIVNEFMDKYKDMILHLADEIDKMREEINKEEQK